MSDQIKHECGIALIRLRKPLQYFKEKYGTELYGINKLYLLMEKQHNRGQDGAGIAGLKLDPKPGNRFISRRRSNDQQPIKAIFAKTYQKVEAMKKRLPEISNDLEKFKRKVPFAGEILLGHLRYGTHGKNRIEQCHPFLRQSNWMSRSLILAGNFNFTNVDKQFKKLISLGQHPKEKADTVISLENIGHFLDEENHALYQEFEKTEGKNPEKINQLIHQHLDVQKVLKRATKDWDGGYTIAGIIGHGDVFVVRDPAGIRPAFYYANDEIVVVTSERPAIQTAFNVPFEEIQAIKPGHALIVKKDASFSEKEILEPLPLKQCSFERIYFSRSSDKDIYQERKNLGKLLCSEILENIEYNLQNTVFSYIPNTAETAFYGMIEGIQSHLDQYRTAEILKMKDNFDEARIKELMALKPRIEKAAIKDVKLRTFITEDASRDDLVAHVYDTTYGITQKNQDTLVVIDDSIVRGTTLQKSILRILDRLNPQKIIVVSSAPQIRYPDCYGIDMSKFKEFVAFRAAIALIEERNMEDLLEKVFVKCLEAKRLGEAQTENFVKEIYQPFTNQEISNKIAEIVKPKGLKAEVQVIYQSIENLHQACPNHLGDWYFSGNYPTSGGNKVVNQAFINYMKKSEARAY